MTGPSRLEVTDGVSAFTGAGFVVVRWGAESGQWTPAEARTHALHVLQCAEAAEIDAVMVKTLRADGLPLGSVAELLVRLRQGRQS